MKVFRGRHCFIFGLPLIFILIHVYYVMEFYKNSKTEVPHKQFNKKFDHLILGPAAGQGLPNRLQCQGTKALNRSGASNSRSGLDESVTFVTVFTIYNSSLDNVDDKSSKTVVGNASYNKVDRSMAVLNVFINFIQVAMPQSKVVILTDPASDLSVRRNSVSLYHIQGEYSRDKLMLQRIRSYIIFLETKLQNLPQNPRNITHYIFTDSDIAVVDDLGQIFRDHPNFDLALTFRNNKAQPLNSGFIAVKGSPDSILRAKLFLQEVLKIYSSKYINASRMLGDQLALAWVVKSEPHFDARRFAKPLAFAEDIGYTSVLFLPCALYNWTPPEGAGQFHGMPLDVKVVHFKGSRKRLMLESWNFYSSSMEIDDMLCLILGSGRTKYDF
ncbi:putative nucleotide-diphospho-sugar transferase [Lupinus albus]|uniref:Putative nucleotide-diphospho-sugar transferase n=1 Tax=Lupinus albus TaxID=3870 RepID=A0A6A4R903_LUPAL|nr:putative nucleotide-diphospho-sugar transferase [Lupinus albus]